MQRREAPPILRVAHRQVLPRRNQLVKKSQELAQPSQFIFESICPLYPCSFSAYAHLLLNSSLSFVLKSVSLYLPVSLSAAPHRLLLSSLSYFIKAHFLALIMVSYNLILYCAPIHQFHSVSVFDLRVLL